MEDLMVYEESLGDVGYSKMNTVICASWSDSGKTYISRGKIVDGKLEVYVEDDEFEDEILIDVPYIDEIIDAIKDFEDEQYFKILVDESRKAPQRDTKAHLSFNKDLYFFIDGKHVRYQPVGIDGIYNVYETIDEQEVFTGQKLLTNLEHYKLVKKEAKEDEAN